ncbi:MULTISPECIES: multidrug transporter subunit MdtD [Kosakonia]|jgi:EmrB/QacA subfamily drug resistance transporter|uniref:MFS transporter n=1 Tax=Kosakonia cowanii JCM 10956 = DSM 18146 TaxID=1300165 RepID=A0A807LHT8_9ENTR|nr:MULTISPECIES: multidrug transporter subunit MdtD [Kosakonia]MBS5775765.1 multidrug transporter subunit MdtD [Enterobacter cloacae]MDP9768984.1 EmrB/QacA subfamily drug resistance transporter [Atlantibacter hermannii]MDT3410090.1 EmrB/QacA subfamily drug resistance transporter [Atlantibacter sp. SORGH_AS_0304]APZ04952.1 MFS transporter [Kosakonia cowanii] [Kosakonia cowanii JCM 10956 = DSM 18146]AST71362.1 MFS transporter [Kosakonia cowanii]
MTKKKGRSMAGLPWIAAMAFFMQALDATILNTALPAIAQSLNRSPLAMQSAIISYTLTVAMLIPVSGWLADRFGTRRIFMLAVSLFTLGSLACALSNSLGMLVVFRVIQGIGGAMMMPVARLALLRAYPRSELLPVLNFVTMPGLVGPILGPVMGGVLVTWASWHWIFLINIPIGVAGLLYARKYMPNFTTPRRSFDMWGFLLFGLSLVLFSSGMELFGEKVVETWLALSIIFSGIALLLLYIRHARRHPTPLISLNLFKTRTFSVGIAGNIASRLGTGCVPFLMPLMLQVGFGYPALIAGCMMAPTALGSILAKSTVTQILRWFGYRKTLVGVTLFIGVMIAQFALQTQAMAIWMLVLPLFILGMAMSTQFTAMNTISLADLTDENASSGNSVLAVTQQLSISLGVAVSAAVLRFYEGVDGTNTVEQFHYTFITMGAVTVVSALTFMLLKAKDGRNLIKERHKKSG